MTIQISQRGKEYLETARTFLRAAKAVTDSAMRVSLRPLADNYQRRAEKASQFDAAKAFARSAASVEREQPRSPDGQLLSIPDVGILGARPSHARFAPPLPPAALVGLLSNSRLVL